LWRHLWQWALLALTAVWFTLVAVAYYTGEHEAGEMTDGQLLSAAELLLRLPGEPTAAFSTGLAMPAGRSLGANTYSPELRVVMWANERVVLDTHGLSSLLPSTLALGNQTVSLILNGQPIRFRAHRTDAVVNPALAEPSRRVVVLVEISRLKALGRDIAEHLVRPALVLLPLVALMLAWAIRRGLVPVNQLSQDIATLDVDTGQMLAPGQRYRELSSTVQAINALVQRLQVQAQRERRFTSDVAHELRTPLTALVLQARLVRHGSTPEQRQAAAEQVESEALRSGRILSQLLDLARAEGLDRQPAEPVDLRSLALQAVREQAPVAHALGQDLALEAPSQPVWVRGHVTMLELALRNLVDNAIRHTPPGTQIEVRIERHPPGEIVLSVNDDGARAGTAQASQPGLGIGLTLVRRIADLHGVALRTDSPELPMTTRFALVWPDSAG
jgi:two-component system sensor histidine kinase QseC